jgi:predicted DNA-binding transcriptional regulator AlpA
MEDASRLLTPAQAAERLGLATATLAKLRVRGTGPEFVKLGSAVRYPAAGLAAYVASAPRHRQTAEYTPRRARQRTIEVPND